MEGRMDGVDLEDYELLILFETVIFMYLYPSV